MQGYKTIIVNGITLGCGLIAALTGHAIPVETQIALGDNIGAVVGGALAVHSLINIGLRFFTKGRVGEKR